MKKVYLNWRRRIVCSFIKAERSQSRTHIQSRLNRHNMTVIRLVLYDASISSYYYLCCYLTVWFSRCCLELWMLFTENGAKFLWFAWKRMKSTETRHTKRKFPNWLIANSSLKKFLFQSPFWDEIVRIQSFWAITYFYPKWYYNIRTYLQGHQSYLFAINLHTS